MSDHQVSYAVNAMLDRLYFKNKAFQSLGFEEQQTTNNSLSLKQQKTGLKNQLGKLTDRPTLRWIFQCFQGIHLRPIQDNQKIKLFVI